MLGVLLYAAGVAALMHLGIALVTRKKMIDGIGRFHRPAQKAARLPLIPLVGGAALVSGTMFLLIGLINR
jgi:uncharacterized membrane protein